MAVFSVSVNNEPLVTVAMDSLNLLDVHIGGTKHGPDMASLSVAGGSYPKDHEPTYLIWIDNLVLNVGDLVQVTFLERGESYRAGETIECLYPDEPDQPGDPIESAEDALRELRKKPLLFESLSMRVTDPDGNLIGAATTEIEHGFGFSVSWVSQRPNIARVTLHTYSLQGLVDKDPGSYHLDARMKHGQSVSFELTPNKALQQTLDPAVPFAAAKGPSASSAAELGSYAARV